RHWRATAPRPRPARRPPSAGYFWAHRLLRIILGRLRRAEAKTLADRCSRMPVALHQGRLMVPDRMAFGWGCRPVSVGAELPAPGSGIQCRIEDVVELAG